MSELLRVSLDVVVLALCMWVIRMWFVKVEKKVDKLAAKIDEKVSESTCKERAKKCSDEKCIKIGKLEKQSGEQWAVINHHGHKGLTGEQGQVVRV